MRSTAWKWSGSLKLIPERVAALDAHPGKFAFGIVGELHCQEALASICGGKSRNGHRHKEVALLIPYENRRDKEAVGVLMGEEQLVGHLTRDDARRMRRALIAMGLEGCSLKVPALIVGGWDRGDGDEGHFGVKLDLPV
jgi:hypothetical protein